jgi:hypothetical protein
MRDFLYYLLWILPSLWLLRFLYLRIWSAEEFWGFIYRLAGKE